MLRVLTPRSRLFQKKGSSKDEAPQEQAQPAGPSRKKALHLRRLKDRYFQSSHRSKDVDVDITSMFDDEESACDSLLYSDNEEVERDFQQHQLQQLDEQSVSSSRSHRSSFSSMSSRRRRRRKSKTDSSIVSWTPQESAPVTETSKPISNSSSSNYGEVTDLDDIIDSFARKRDPSHTKILIPTTPKSKSKRDNKCRVNDDDDRSTTSSVLERARKKIVKVWKHNKPHRSSGPSRKKKYAKYLNNDEDDAEDKESLDSLLARFRGCSHDNKQNPKRKPSGTSSLRQRSTLETEVASTSSCSYTGLRTTTTTRKKVLAEQVRGYDCDTGSKASKEDLSQATVLPPRERNPKPSYHHESPFRAFSAVKKPPIIDPLDIERLLNKSDVEEEMIMFDESSDCGSAVSSLSSSSSLSLSPGSPTSVLDDDLNTASRFKAAPPNHRRGLLDPAFGKNYGALPAPTTLFHDSSPKKDRASYSIPSTMQVKSHISISILLIDPRRKTFEIVSVHLLSRGTSIGEVLEKARAGAVDKDLSLQTYSGLCNDGDFTSNRDLPILKFLPSSQNGPRTKRDRFVSDDDQIMKREMERRLLVAVPTHSTPKECQKIRSLLWKNAKLQAWWHASAPLSRLGVA